MMKPDWKSETTAAVAAFALTGVALWGSMIPMDPTPALHGNDRVAPALVKNGVSVIFAMREGYHA